MTTALKFDISEGKTNTYRKILSLLNECHLEEALTIDNFVSYHDYFNENLLKLYKIQRVIIEVASILFLIDIVLVTLTFGLFLEARMNEIVVKESLGFRRLDILKQILEVHIIITIIPIILVLIVMIIRQYKSLNLLLVFSATIFLLEVIINTLILSFVSFKKITQQLKGGE